MGSRGRSIRLMIYILVAIPLITMLSLLGFVAYTSVTDWLNQDRAPTLINATSVPLTNFVNLLQGERRAAVVYVSHPDGGNLSAFQHAMTVTNSGELQLMAAFNSSGTKNTETPDEAAAINKMTAALGGMNSLRAAVEAGKLSPLTALLDYTNIIADQGAVLRDEANSLTNVAAAEQGFALIASVDAQEGVSEMDAVLAGALASGSLTADDRVAFSQAMGRLQDDTQIYQQLFTPAEVKTYTTTLNSLIPKALQKDLASIEEAVPAGATLKQMEARGLSLSAWHLLTSTWLHAASVADTTTAAAVLTANESTAISAKSRVWETSSVGAAGLILSVIVTILLGRSINRRLTGLRKSALTLAQEQLPAVVARLRRGEDVDIAAEAPPLRAGSDEIGQVSQAIDMVRQTAIRSAVEEARLRRGINDVFRNLARRNQSLLQRQLTVLDGMERNATDPDVLEDLFKMDHLTTRMRRHAEGLIILSGAAPGRAWSAPVKLIDVIRGAIAEVEDYARVAVATQSKAALSGSAVTGVIHMLAELIENATTLSPPFTQVRVSGETVGNGFAIEIEDRGLGMPPQRMAELNERLANPPDINPTNTEQLGLFVVGQLARRHGISVTLRPSPYGGITAVALIPQRLIVEEGPAAITAGGPGTAVMAGAYGSSPNAYQSYDSTAPAGPSGSGGPYRGEGGYSVSYGSDGGFSAAYGPGGGNGGSYEPYPGNGGNGSAYKDQPFHGFTPPPPPPGAPPDLDSRPTGPGPYGRQGRDGAGMPPSSTRASGPVRQHSAHGDEHSGTAGPRRGRHGAADVPVVTGVPVTRPATSSFDVFTPLHRPEDDGSAAQADPGGPGDAPYAESYTNYSSDDGGYDQASHDDSGGGDYKGLPRRVRQANLAPQLRSSPATGSDGPASVPRATSASLTDMRNTLSAMQRGWQQGRSQSHPDTEGGSNGD